MERLSPDSVKLKVIEVNGMYTFGNTLAAFTGTVSFEGRLDCIYYTFQLNDVNGQIICSRSTSVSKRVIPKERRDLDYAIEHALEGIRSYRIGRVKIIRELKISDI